MTEGTRTNGRVVIRWQMDRGVVRRTLKQWSCTTIDEMARVGSEEDWHGRLETNVRTFTEHSPQNLNSRIFKRPTRSRCATGRGSRAHFFIMPLPILSGTGF